MKQQLELLLVVLLFSIVVFTMAQPQAAEASSVAGELRPVGGTEYRVVIEDNNNNSRRRRRRRRLAPYEVCLPCKCCAGGNTTTCITMPCCFGIDCQLPHKPFGVCAFLPKSCNCTSCGGSS